MAQAATNPKIEELRGRLKSDPKSRLFYPLAEELRKISQFNEAESVLRGGLSSHPTYLSAWVSLGRVLRDQKKNTEAAEALNKALLLDPGNVVAARLLADSYLDLGEKVEAIKKYKLVYALLPSDDTLEGTIEKLEAEINAPPLIPEPMEAPFEITGRGGMGPAAVPAAEPASRDDERVFDETGSSILKQQRMDISTGDAEPMRAAHTESPFEDPGVTEGYGSNAFAIEQPGGMHITGAPPTSELPMPLPFEPLPDEAASPPASEPMMPADEADVFEPAGSGIAPGIVTQGYSVTSSMDAIDEADFARTIRMADLYASEGSYDEARDIYEDLLARDPNNATIRSKLNALPATPPPTPAAEAPDTSPTPSRNPKVEKLESWLSRVKRV
jgi:tetratricopeptide (TPR) repeat protein